MSEELRVVDFTGRILNYTDDLVVINLKTGQLRIPPEPEYPFLYSSWGETFAVRYAHGHDSVQFNVHKPFTPEWSVPNPGDVFAIIIPDNLMRFVARSPPAPFYVWLIDKNHANLEGGPEPDSEMFQPAMFHVFREPNE